MKYRTLGQDLVVSSLGMGCLTLTEPNYGAVDMSASKSSLSRALDLGITLLDTGETYGAGRNEAFIGEVIRKRRDELVIGTKFGMSFDPSTGEIKPDARPEGIRPALDGSLRRLRTDRVDIYYLHRVDVAVPIEETWGVLAELVQEGKVRYTGMSEPGIGTLRRAHVVHPVAVVQNEYSLFSRGPELSLIPTLRDLGIGLACFSPLGRGLLSGRIRTHADLGATDYRRRLPWFQGENLVQNIDLVDRLRKISGSLNVSSAQLALAWLLTRGDNVVPIPSMETIDMLEENLSAIDLEWGEDVWSYISDVVAGGVSGARLSEHDTTSSAESV